LLLIWNLFSNFQIMRQKLDLKRQVCQEAEL
jgi:hypothetical protein